MSILGDMIRNEFMADRELDPYGSVRMMIMDLAGAAYVNGWEHLIPEDWQYKPGLSVQEGRTETWAMHILKYDMLSGKINEQDVERWLRALYMYETLVCIAGRDY